MSMFDTGHGSNSLNSTRASIALETIANNTKKKEEKLTAEQEMERIKLTKYVVNAYLLFTAFFFTMLMVVLVLLLK